MGKILLKRVHVHLKNQEELLWRVSELLPGEDVLKTRWYEAFCAEQKVLRLWEEWKN